MSGVAQVILHESFSKFPFYYNDIAILTLSKPLNYDDNTQAIPLIPRPLQYEEEAYVSGWGDSSNAHQRIANLKAMKITIKNGFLYWLLRRSSGIISAVTSNAEGICNGDSGGPLTVQGYLAGIISSTFHQKCDIPEALMFFTSIEYHKEWIEQNVKIKGFINGVINKSNNSLSTTDTMFY